MKISYRNTFFDHLAFNVHYLPRNPVLMLMMVGLFIHITFTGIVPAVSKLPGGVVTFMTFITMELILALSIVLLVAIPIVLLLVFRRISRKNRTFFCEITITLCQETFVVESQYSKSEVKWDMVQKLARTRKHIFIYSSQESALIIPRRVFEGTTQWNEFYGICKQKISRTA